MLLLVIAQIKTTMYNVYISPIFKEGTQMQLRQQQVNGPCVISKFIQEEILLEHSTVKKNALPT